MNKQPKTEPRAQIYQDCRSNKKTHLLRIAPFVGVVFYGGLPVGLLEVVLRRCLRDPEDLVVLSVVALLRRSPKHVGSQTLLQPIDERSDPFEIPIRSKKNEREQENPRNRPLLLFWVSLSLRGDCKGEALIREERV